MSYLYSFWLYLRQRKLVLWMLFVIIAYCESCYKANAWCYDLFIKKFMGLVLKRTNINPLTLYILLAAHWPESSKCTLVPRFLNSIIAKRKLCIHTHTNMSASGEPLMHCCASSPNVLQCKQPLPLHNSGQQRPSSCRGGRLQSCQLRGVGIYLIYSVIVWSTTTMNTSFILTEISLLYKSSE